MSETTAISWTHSTFNPWSGCAKLSAGCANCYAAALPPGMRRGADWGEGKARVVASESYWNEPVKWNAKAAKSGEPWRVFCASTADVFEDRDDLDEHRARLFKLIEATPALTWLLTTKRADAIMRRVPASWCIRFPRNVWVLVSVEDQRAADERIPHLLCVPAVVRGLSMEPLLGPVDLDPATCPYCGEGGDNIGVADDGATPWCNECNNEAAFGWWLDGCASPTQHGINWIITGGESGHRARPMDEQWVRDIHRQARQAGVAIHHKQMGAVWAEQHGALHKKGGYPGEWPAEFNVREFPEVDRE